MNKRKNAAGRTPNTNKNLSDAIRVLYLMTMASPQRSQDEALKEAKVPRSSFYRTISLIKGLGESGDSLENKHGFRQLGESIIPEGERAF